MEADVEVDLGGRLSCDDRSILKRQKQGGESLLIAGIVLVQESKKMPSLLRLVESLMGVALCEQVLKVTSAIFRS